MPRRLTLMCKPCLAQPMSYPPRKHEGLRRHTLHTLVRCSSCNLVFSAAPKDPTNSNSAQTHLPCTGASGGHNRNVMTIPDAVQQHKRRGDGRRFPWTRDLERSHGHAGIETATRPRPFIWVPCALCVPKTAGSQAVSWNVWSRVEGGKCTGKKGHIHPTNMMRPAQSPQLDAFSMW
jgi:hypothetical protein